MADLFMVLDSFLVNGELYQKGEIVDASDPILRKSPHLFGPLVIRGGVEQATAAPGEKRTLRLGRKPKAKAPEPKPEPEPEPEPVGKPLTSASFRPGGR